MSRARWVVDYDKFMPLPKSDHSVPIFIREMVADMAKRRRQRAVRKKADWLEECARVEYWYKHRHDQVTSTKPPPESSESTD